MADYAANPTKAKQDQQMIDLRKRMLAVFLNRCRRMEEVRNDGVWWRFLDPNTSWVCDAIKVVILLANYVAERGPSLASYCINSKVQHEGTTS